MARNVEDLAMFFEIKNSQPTPLNNEGASYEAVSVPYSVFTVSQKRLITFVVAFFLGLWLIISIIRSGRL